MTKKELIEALEKDSYWKDNEDKTCLFIIGDKKDGQGLFNGSLEIGVEALEAAMEEQSNIKRTVEIANAIHTLRKNKVTFNK